MPQTIPPSLSIKLKTKLVPTVPRVWVGLGLELVGSAEPTKRTRPGRSNVGQRPPSDEEWTASPRRPPLVSTSARPRQHRSVGEASALVTLVRPRPRSRRAINARQRPPPKSWARPVAHLLPRPSPGSVPSAINGHPLPPVAPGP